MELYRSDIAKERQDWHAFIRGVFNGDSAMTLRLLIGGGQRRKMDSLVKWNSRIRKFFWKYFQGENDDLREVLIRRVYSDIHFEISIMYE